MSFSPERLTVARERRAMTKGALAAICGVSSKTISAYESGTSVPLDGNLQRLADALDFPILYFAGSGDVPEASGVSFRARSRIGTRNKLAAVAVAKLCIQQIDAAIQDLYKLPELALPEGLDLSANPEMVAAQVRAHWGLGIKRAPNMVHLLESKGIRVYSLPPDISQKVDAFCLWNDGVPFVFLNQQKSAERGRWDAAHELAHLLLHAEKDTPGSREDEREADDFASAFLMPREEILATAPKQIHLKSIIRYKKRWGTSAAAVVYRFWRLGLLTDWSYKSLMIELSAAGYRKSEPEPLPRESSKLFRQVFADLRSQGISANRMARKLNIAPRDLHEATFSQALTVVHNNSDLSPELKIV